MFIDHGLCSCHREQTGVTIMNTTKTLIAVSILAAFLPGIANALPGYLTDTDGKVVKNSYGLCWRTGSWTPAMAIAECDPDFVKTADVPAPKLAEATPESVPTPSPEPQRLAPQKVSFSADALFAFDKAVLKPEGKAELDNFAQNLSGVSYESIHITGNTDRFGSNKYNQKLSEQRANAVRDYLVSKDVAANRMVVEGLGETQPSTKPDDCTGPKSKKVIACLQPDRRVDIEVTGSK
jgi:OOP family OmpA-OmpF porin